MKSQPQCKQCGECCKTFAVRRVVKTKRIVEYATARGYTFDGNTMLVPSPCPQLLEDGKCHIYETRPQICRDYTGKSQNYYTPPGCAFRK